MLSALAYGLLPMPLARGYAAGGPVEAEAAFSLDRRRWGVAFRRSELKNDLVDDEIFLRVLVVAAR